MARAQINHPSVILITPSSDNNHAFSEYNRPFASKQLRKAALRELIHKSLLFYDSLDLSFN